MLEIEVQDAKEKESTLKLLNNALSDAFSEF